MADPLIHVAGASRTLPDGSSILHSLELDVERGKSIAIVGRSGCGKSTLLSCLGLISPFDRGSAYVLNGTDVSTLTDRALARLRATSVGFVLQNSGLVPHLSAIENVAVPLMHSSALSVRQIRRRAAEALDQLDVGHLAHRRPAQVSGGERQRVAIARALVIEPHLILADEPTGALDERTGTLVLDRMLEVVARSSASLVVVTHDKEIAARTGRTLHLRDGRLHTTAEAAE